MLFDANKEFRLKEPIANDNVIARLSLPAIFRMNDEEAHAAFAAIRWAWNREQPVCPSCGIDTHYWLSERRTYKCRGCEKQYTVTSGTIFSSRKLPFQTYLATIALFAQAAKGISACQMSRTMDVSYKTAFVLCHKIREAVMRTVEDLVLTGVVEIDGCTIGGYRKAENFTRGNFVKRRYVKKFDNRLVVVAARERHGRTIPFVVDKEFDAKDRLIEAIHPAATLCADQAHAWDGISELFESLRINHKVAYADGDSCTNWAESFFSVLRRMHYGTHHKISKGLMINYATELAWRQDTREWTPHERIECILVLALNSPVSRRWAKYWQRHKLVGDVK